MQGTFRKIDDKTLVAVGVPALEALAAVHRGEDCIVDVRGARNVPQFNLFWTLCQLVAAATDTTKEGVKEWLMKRLNYVDLIELPDGSVEIRAQSIAWHKMEQAKFAEFFRAAVPRVAELLGSSERDVMDRYVELIGPTGRDHLRKVMRDVGSPSLVPDASQEREKVS